MHRKAAALKGSQPYSINQFHFDASPGDAITQQMLFLKEALAEIGIGGKIFAVNRKHLPVDKVETWDPGRAWDADVLLIHHSQGNPILSRLLDLEIPKAFVYHNITPATFFAHDPELSRISAEGRAQLPSLIRSCIAGFADSKYNLAELEELGFAKGELLPLFDLKPSATPFHSSDEAQHLLFVGRISPHKNQALLIKAFYYLLPQLRPGSKLFLVGSGDPVYSRYLKLLIKNLGLEKSVVLTGKVTQSNLAHYYEIASAFVCASLHEGFCIPLVEAMKAGLPVFFSPLTGVKETMQNSGVQMNTTDPKLMAEALACVLFEETLQRQVVEGQNERLLTLSKGQNKKVAQRRLLALCESIRPKLPPASLKRPHHEPRIS